SAFGCCTAEITDTTLNASYCFALSSTPSTSRPIIVSLSVISDSDASVSRCSFSQVRVNFIARLLSRRPEIKNRQHKEDDDGEHDGGADAVAVKFAADDQLTLDDVVRAIRGLGEFIGAEDRQAAQATKRDQKIDRDFGNDDPDLDLIIGDKRGDQSQAGDHH